MGTLIDAAAETLGAGDPKRVANMRRRITRVAASANHATGTTHVAYMSGGSVIAFVLDDAPDETTDEAVPTAGQGYGNLADYKLGELRKIADKHGVDHSEFKGKGAQAALAAHLTEALANVPIDSG